MGQDLGDSIYDSTVFLDRFFWSTDVTCTSGAASDTDGDGLLDTWESAGLTVGGVFVDLPAMGAGCSAKVSVALFLGGRQPGGGKPPAMQFSEGG